MKNLRIIDFDFNNIEQWDEVWKLRYLPALEILQLNQNKIPKLFFEKDEKQYFCSWYILLQK